MPRIKPIDLHSTDSDTSATLLAAQNKLGMLPNLFTTLAQAPAALNGYLRLADALAGGRLTARQRELIAIAVAQENACEYCLSAHSAIGAHLGLQPEDLDRARVGQARNPADAAYLSFALAVARSRGAVSDTDLTAVREAGANDGLVIEIVANVALNVLTNYVNRVAGTEVDFPVIRLGRAA